MIRRVFACLLALAVVVCGGAYAKEAIELNVVCTSFPCYDFIRAVMGDASNVKMLIKPGTEVHSYEPTPADVMAIAECDLFVYIGGESDAWAEDLLESFGKEAPRTLRFYDLLDAEAGHAHDVHSEEHEHSHELDEHIWLSPKTAISMLELAADVLCDLDADGAEAYHANAQAYGLEITALADEIQDLVDHAARRELIFADRFPFLHFVNEFGLSYTAAFPSCAAESEPSAKILAELIGKVMDQKVPVVYVLEMSSEKTARAIAEETGVQICSLHSMQTVTEAQFAAGETYLSLMAQNIEALREGLN